jgi:hypothetical protein
MWQRSKQWFLKHEFDLFLVLLIIISLCIAFSLGRLSTVLEKREPVIIRFPNSSTTPPRAGESTVPSSQTEQALNLVGQAGLLVGSKNSTKYHFPWCSGALRITEANKVYFNSREEARNKGYTPASNCPGLE